MLPGAKAPFLRTAALVALALALALAAACGDDDDGGTTPATAATKDTPAAATGPAGSVTVTSSVISGQQGKILLIFASPTSGGPMARACIRITSDKFTPPATPLSEAGSSQDPCAPASGQAILAKGEYTVSAGIYAPPANTPEKEWKQPLTVPGDAALKVAIDGAALSK